MVEWPTCWSVNTVAKGSTPGRDRMKAPVSVLPSLSLCNLATVGLVLVCTTRPKIVAHVNEP